MRYRVNPAGVQTVLTATAVTAKELVTALAPLPGAVEQIDGGCDKSPAIMSALNDLLSGEYKRLDAMAARVETCVTGAAQATTAYVQADDQMTESARRAQAHAVAVARHLPR